MANQPQQEDTLLVGLVVRSRDLGSVLAVTMSISHCVLLATISNVGLRGMWLTQALLMVPTNPLVERTLVHRQVEGRPG